jgi:quinoprotein glucose dehydrogenase
MEHADFAVSSERAGSPPRNRRRRGQHVWVTPNGDGPRFDPLLKSLNLPPLGYPNRPAPLLTKTLLFLGEGGDAVSGTASVDWNWRKKFRAYDKATGKVIWEMKLPSGTTAGPMTYLLKRKQYIVVSVGAQSRAGVRRAGGP